MKTHEQQSKNITGEYNAFNNFTWRKQAAHNEPVELLVFKIIFNRNTLTGMFSFNNQKRLRFWRFLFLHLGLFDNEGIFT